MTLVTLLLPTLTRERKEKERMCEEEKREKGEGNNSRMCHKCHGEKHGN